LKTSLSERQKANAMTTQTIAGLTVEIEPNGGDAKYPVVCLHGLGGSSNNWTPVMRALQSFSVIRIDLPGSGRSGSGVGALSMTSMTESVIAVCRALDVSAAHFVGHSMGTIVCQHIAILQPSLIKNFVLFGPLACPPDAARPHIEARAAKAASGGAAAMQEIADAIVQGATSASTKDQLPVAVALVRESLMRQNPQDYAKSCLALAQAQSADLESIQASTLLVTGSEDTVAPPATVHEMARRLRHARVVVLDRCGHWTTFERPIECANLLRDFLR
jgi:3-oxoadipate enol-lactonase